MTARQDALARLDAIVVLAEQVRRAALAAQEAVTQIISPQQPREDQS